MSSVIQYTDFTGVYRLAVNNYTSTNLQVTINQHETNILYKLLGQELATLYLANLTNGVPTDARFLTIHNAFLKGETSDPKQSIGIKNLLLAYVYYEYITGNTTISTDAGETKLETETANVQSQENNFRKAESRFNAMLDSWEAIQWYCSEEASADYPEFAGISEGARFFGLL